MMTVVSVVVAVFLCLAVLFGVVWFAPIWIRVVYREELTVYAGIGPVYKKLVPSKPEKKKEPEKNKSKRKKSNSKKQDSDAKQKETAPPSENTVVQDGEKKSVSEVLDTVRTAVEQVFELFHKKAKIKIDALNVVVAKEEAADTAIQFGLCSGVVSAILALASGFGKSVIKDENVSIQPDFVSGKSRIETDVTLSVRTCHAVILLLKMLVKKS